MSRNAPHPRFAHLLPAIGEKAYMALAPRGGERVAQGRVRGFTTADHALQSAVRLWLIVTVIGQWAFLYYIFAVYGSSTLQGNFQAWSKNRFLFKGYVPGDTAGNLSFAVHALLVGVMAFGGIVQLIPQIRLRAMAIHRWNGRLFLVTSLGASVTGLYMVWVRGARESVVGGVAVSLNALLIIVCAVRAWRAALQRDMTSHRRWALRTFMVANGQWFIRVGMVAWMILNQGQYRGFYRFWSFGCYLVPLAALELYFYAKARGGPSARFAVATLITMFTLLMGVGISGTAVFLWQQVLTKL